MPHHDHPHGVFELINDRHHHREPHKHGHNSQVFELLNDRKDHHHSIDENEHHHHHQRHPRHHHLTGVNFPFSKLDFIYWDAGLNQYVLAVEGS